MIGVDIEMPKSCDDYPFKEDEKLPTACIFRRWRSLSLQDTPKNVPWCPLIDLGDDGK